MSTTATVSDPSAAAPNEVQLYGEDAAGNTVSLATAKSETTHELDIVDGKPVYVPKQSAVPAVWDKSIKAKVTRGAKLLNQGIKNVFEGGKLLYEANQATSQKSKEKISSITWDQYLEGVGLRPQTARDAINFYKKLAAVEPEKLEEALEQPSRPLALEAAGYEKKPRNTSTPPNDEAKKKSKLTGSDDDRHGLYALRGDIENLVDGMGTGKIQPSMKMASGLHAAAEKLVVVLARFIEQRADMQTAPHEQTAPDVQTAKVVGEVEKPNARAIDDFLTRQR